MKTLGTRTAQLFTELYQRQRTTFSLPEVEAITGLSNASARSLLSNAQKRGLLTRLKPGLYNLVPFELGEGTHFVADPLLLAGEAVGHLPYFLSHGTAFELHRLVTQPNFTLYVSCARRLKPKRIGGYDFHFVLVNPEAMFGLEKHWVTKTQAVPVSDLERTLLDGLHHPQFAGGLGEVAKGLWMRRDDLRVERLVEYALRLQVGIVYRRLGYLLEFYGLAAAPALSPLRERLTATYGRLDPTLPPEGRFVSRWKLQLNLAPEELEAVRFG